MCQDLDTRELEVRTKHGHAQAGDVALDIDLALSLIHIFTVAAALVNWWENNSFTPEAIEADQYLTRLKPVSYTHLFRQDGRRHRGRRAGARGHHAGCRRLHGCLLYTSARAGHAAGAFQPLRPFRVEHDPGGVVTVDKGGLCLLYTSPGKLFFLGWLWRRAFSSCCLQWAR